MSITVSSLVITSIILSLVGLFLFGFLSASAYRRFRKHPSERTTWVFIASTAMVVALLALLVTASAAALSQSGASAEVREFMAHLAMMLRGALVTFGIALVYGQRRMHKQELEEDI